MALFEIEKKFPVKDMQPCRTAVLDRFTCQIKPVVHQSDLYLTHPARDFEATDEAFRIRSVQVENGPCQILMTYKGPRIAAGNDGNEFKTRREIEVEVGDQGPDAAKKLRDMFLALGFRPVIEVKKTRERLLTNHRNWSIEFALDRVEGLGSFLEIEAVAESARIEDAQDVLAGIASDLKLSGAITTSYLGMLLEQHDWQDRR